MAAGAIVAFMVLLNPHANINAPIPASIHRVPKNKKMTNNTPGPGAGSGPARPSQVVAATKGQVEESSSSPTISRRKTVTKRGRQVKAQFRALFHKKESSSSSAQEEEKDVISTTTTSVQVLDEKNKYEAINKPVKSSTTSENKKPNILVTATATTDITSSDESLPVVTGTPLRPTPPVPPQAHKTKSSESNHHSHSQSQSQSQSLSQSTPSSTNTNTHNRDKERDRDQNKDRDKERDKDKEKETLTAEITRLQNALQTAQTRTQSLENRLAKADLQTHKLTRKSEILTNSLCRANTDFEGTRQKLQDTIDSLRSEIHLQQVQVQEQKREKRQGGPGGLGGGEDTESASASEVEMLLMKEQSRVRSLKMTVEKRDREVEDLSNRLGRADGKVRILRGEVSRLRGERDRARRENEFFRGIIDDLGMLGIGDSMEKEKEKGEDDLMMLDPGSRRRLGMVVGVGLDQQQQQQQQQQQRGAQLIQETEERNVNGRERRRYYFREELEEDDHDGIGGHQNQNQHVNQNQSGNGSGSGSGLTEAERAAIRKEKVRKWIGDGRDDLEK